MNSRTRLAARAALPAGAVLALLVPALPTVADTPSTCTLAVEALAVTPTTVDATVPAAVTVAWTIRNSNAAAQTVSGTVSIRMRGATPGSYVGVSYDVPYSYRNKGLGGADYVSGTPQLSSYTYAFAVPRYAGTTTAKWAVTQVTAVDGQGGTLVAGDRELGRFHPVVTATEMVDSAAPIAGSLRFDSDYTVARRPYVYDDGTTSRVGYDLDVQDLQSGFWKASLVVAGPGGARLTADVAVTGLPTEPHCGTHAGGDPIHDTICGFVLDVPPGSPVGTYTVSAVRLTDNAGNTVTDHPAGPSFVLTRNGTVSASGFTVTPNPVNNWAQNAPVQLTLAVAGAQQGVSAVYADAGVLDVSGHCPQVSTTPTANPDGTLSVSLLVYQGSQRCGIDGVAVVDGAGNVALYGAEYDAPDPGVAITRVPDVAPTVDSAALSVTSVPASQVTTAVVEVRLDVVAPVAPVVSYDLFVYDAAGAMVTSDFGGVDPVSGGPLSLRVWLPAGMAPGTYTIAFVLHDAGRLSTSYGGPGGPPVPGGPLLLTVTDG